MKYVKANAYEDEFFIKLNTKRDEELKLLSKRFWLTATMIFCNWSANPFVINATFATYIWVFGKDMTAAVGFSLISIFSIISESMF